MKKQLQLFSIIFVLTTSMLFFSRADLGRPVQATYVEGSVNQDTFWTLVNSPFVVTNDVVVEPNVTLTIEPGVEIRFAGNFSLSILGRLMANGTITDPIVFTSSKLQPDKGDWSTIIFNSAEQSFFVNCILEYGSTGLSILTGSVYVENSIIRDNSEDGIHMENGALDFTNGAIIDNIINGIQITGCNRAQVQNSNITSNGDGISLVGHLTSEINIQNNEFSDNTHSGISLETTADDNTVILDNVFTMNDFGFYVSTTFSTTITNNFFSNNSVGIFYSTGAAHNAHFNDFFNNNLAMDVSGIATADARYNYWGHHSGPYHESMNPRGKGDPVGGNGANIDFIFFLSQPTDYANTPPTAVLWTDKSLVAPLQNVTFVGADSYDDQRVDLYYFDFGDGSNSGWTTLPILNHTYSTIGTYLPSLTVTDDFNSTSTNTATTTIDVQNGTPLHVEVTLGGGSVNFNQQVTVDAYVTDGAAPVENATVILFAVKGGVYMPVTGLTDSSGHFTSMYSAPNVTEITNVRIVARASITGYVDGSGFAYLYVLPPLLVEMNAHPSVLSSEETSTLTVHVTLGSEEPIPNALLVLSTTSGNLSAMTGVTDMDGAATFVFTSPQTTVETFVTISVTAMKIGYADGMGQTIITVEPRMLTVELSANPAIVVSESTATVTATVFWNSIPVSDATVNISSSLGGSFSSPTIITDTNGIASFIFTAPRVTLQEGAVTTIVVGASRTGYVDGSAQREISVIARMLAVQVTTEPTATFSESNVNVTVHVAYPYDMSPVSQANVTVSSDSGGIFTIATGLTGSDGNVTFAFTAPQVDSTTNVNITALAQKIGYIDGQSQSVVTVDPGTLEVTVSTAASGVVSNGAATIEVFATRNGTAVANVSVSMTSTYGNFADPIGTTNSTGYCLLIFNAPSTDIQITATITANVTKQGYIGASNQTTLNVTPEVSQEQGDGLSWMTILLILVPVIIAVVIIVLYKLKVVSFSDEEEEE